MMGLKDKLLSVFDREEESSICHTCHGQGTYGQVTTSGNDMIHEVMFCEACDGTGRIQEDGDVD